MHLGVIIRSKGGIIIYSQRPPEIEIDKPIVLAVISKDRWIKNNNYEQDYAVIVMIKHEAQIDIYNRIKQKIQQRIQQKLRSI